MPGRHSVAARALRRDRAIQRGYLKLRAWTSCTWSEDEEREASLPSSGVDVLRPVRGWKSDAWSKAVEIEEESLPASGVCALTPGRGWKRDAWPNADEAMEQSLPASDVQACVRESWCELASESEEEFSLAPLRGGVTKASAEIVFDEDESVSEKLVEIKHQLFAEVGQACMSAVPEMIASAVRDLKFQEWVGVVAELRDRADPGSIVDELVSGKLVEFKQQMFADVGQAFKTVVPEMIACADRGSMSQELVGVVEELRDRIVAVEVHKDDGAEESLLGRVGDLQELVSVVAELRDQIVAVKVHNDDGAEESRLDRVGDLENVVNDFIRQFELRGWATALKNAEKRISALERCKKGKQVEDLHKRIEELRGQLMASGWCPVLQGSSSESRTWLGSEMPVDWIAEGAEAGAGWADAWACMADLKSETMLSDVGEVAGADWIAEGAEAGAGWADAWDCMADLKSETMLSDVGRVAGENSELDVLVAECGGSVEDLLQKARSVYGPHDECDLMWAMCVERAMVDGVEDELPPEDVVFVQLGKLMLRTLRRMGAEKGDERALVQAVVGVMGSEMNYISRGDCWVDGVEGTWEHSYVLMLCKMVAKNLGLQGDG